MIAVLKAGQAKFQLGSNENFFDWTYIDNVVHAHLLAAEKVHKTVPITALSSARPPFVSKTLPRRLPPTSETLSTLR